MSTDSNYPTTDPLSLLVGYKSPPAFTIFGLELLFLLIRIDLKSSLPFYKASGYIVSLTVYTEK